MWPHCFLAFIVSEEKSVVIVIFVPLYLRFLFSVLAFNILSLLLALESLTIMCLGIVFFLFPMFRFC